MCIRDRLYPWARFRRLGHAKSYGSVQGHPGKYRRVYGDECKNAGWQYGPVVQKYVDETKKYILPLLEDAMIRYPQDSNQFFILKYHITSLMDFAERCLMDEVVRKFMDTDSPKWFLLGEQLNQRLDGS